MTSPSTLAFSGGPDGPELLCFEFVTLPAFAQAKPEKQPDQRTQILVSVYVLAAHATQAAHTSSDASIVRYGLVLVIGIVIGRLSGRRAALKHLAEAEFQSRWRNVRGVRRF
jgi:hypothetical protein